MATVINGATVRGAQFSDWSPRQLFRFGEVGAWYDPSDMSTMFQDAYALSPVTAPEQSVATILDRRSPAASFSFDGTGDFVTFDGSSGFAFGTGDFTVEMWVNFSSVTTNYCLFDFRPGSVNGFYPSLFVNTSGQFEYYINSAVVMNPSHGISANTWAHVAVCRSSSSTRIFVNGSQVGTTYSDTSNYLVGANRPCIGANGYTTSVNNLSGFISNFRVIKGTALYPGNFTAPTSPLGAVSGTSLLTCGANWSGNPTHSFSGDVKLSGNNPFYRLLGNHAVQTNFNYFPTISARYNVLTKTESLTDTGVWGTVGATLAATTAVSPPAGVKNVFTLSETAVTNRHVFGHANLITVPSPAITLSITVKKNDRRYVALTFLNSTGYGWFTGLFDLDTGLLSDSSVSSSGTTQTFVSGSATSLGDGWYRLTVSGTTTASIGYVVFAHANAALFSSMTLDTGSPSYAGTAGSFTYVTGVDMRVTGDGTGLPGYQRVNTSTDYDTGGFPMYLRFDGSNDFLATSNIDFSTTDKVSIFSGARKLSDASTAILLELTASTALNTGAFNIQAPIGSSTEYRIVSKGTSGSFATSSVLAAPRSNVLTGLASISGDSVILRVNGTQDGSDTTTDQGTGNYSNAAFYIGSRGGTSWFYNGRIYGMIVRGASSTADELYQAETWMNSKTRAY